MAGNLNLSVPFPTARLVTCQGAQGELLMGPEQDLGEPRPSHVGSGMVSGRNRACDLVLGWVIPLGSSSSYTPVRGGGLESLRGLGGWTHWPVVGTSPGSHRAGGVAGKVPARA